MNNNNDKNKRTDAVPQRTIVAMNIYDLWQSSGLTQTEVAKRAGLSTSALSAYVTGKNYPRAEQMAALARVFGVPVSAITGEVNERVGAPSDLVDEDARRLLDIYQQLPSELRKLLTDVGQTMLNGHNDRRY